MKTFEQLATDCASQASKSWKDWTNFLYVIRIISASFLLAGLGMQFIKHGWAGGIIFILGSVGTFALTKVIEKERQHSWDTFMKIRQDCLDDAQKFKSL